MVESVGRGEVRMRGAGLLDTGGGERRENRRKKDWEDTDMKEEDGQKDRGM